MVSVSCFGVSENVLLYVCSLYFWFGWAAEWPPFGKKLPARLAICSHCILSICNIYLFPVLVLRVGVAF